MLKNSVFWNRSGEENGRSMDKKKFSALKDQLNPHKDPDKAWYLDLLDEGKQFVYEQEHIRAVLLMLRVLYVSPYQRRIAQIREEIGQIRDRQEYSAGDYRALLEKQAELEQLGNQLDRYKCFFAEPYFARIDVVDDAEGYNSYYIGKKGDVNLEIVDWRAPLAVRYYQKTRVSFRINEYEYRTILRRALSVKNGKLLDFRNEYLSVREYLAPEEIAGRDEEILFDPYLRSIIKSRKDDVSVRDIIETIQEQQFEIINLPERENFVLQGCAGSGKTMIMLHRLSYLMYNNESIRPHDVLVITPSDSFNAFIDELSQVLELQKVKTITLRDYFFQVLGADGIDLASKCTDEREPEEYLSLLYSPRFVQEAERKVGKLYGEISGLFVGDECREVAERLLLDFRRRQELFLRIKNASVRVRRCLLGEMKERAEGGVYFTKPLRGLMGAFVQAEDFLTYVLREDVRSPDYFFRQFAAFYRSAQFIAARSEEVFRQAEEDLGVLKGMVEREITDLKRYRRKQGEEFVYTYPERIARRKELLAETEKAGETIASMAEGVDLFREFFSVLHLTGSCTELGKCQNAADIARWLYRNIVKPIKRRYGLKGVYASDGFVLCYLLAATGRQLTPRFGLVFVDEGQDLSMQEYELLRKINSDAAFNVFGDLKQNITSWRGVRDWDASFGNIYRFDRNYRNTNEIVDYVSQISGVRMNAIGLHGEEVRRVSLRRLNSFFKEKRGLKAVIAREEFLPLFEKRGYQRLTKGGRLSKTKINVMSVFESKGLEFSSVAVYEKGMSDNERYIACTRALRELALVDAEEKSG